MRRVVWFSCGAASAALAKVALNCYPDAEIVYCDTMATEHPDNRRFFDDVQTWIGKSITVIRSEKYRTIDEVFDRTRYMAGIAGARCTTELKKLPRERWQKPGDVHLFGYTAEEQKRADRFEENNPSVETEWLLIDKGITKADCLEMLKVADIRLPEMYGLGFDHNNCLGCPKATSAGYWNRVRKHFPDVFSRRVVQSRDIGAKLVRVKGVRVFLDELPRDETAPDDNIECGPVCQSTEEGEP